MKKFLFILIASFFGMMANAQELNPVQWSFDVVKDQGDLKLHFTATIAEGWYLYGQDLEAGGPIPTSFHFESDGAMSFEGFADEISEHKIMAFDEMFAMDLVKYKDQVVFEYTPEVHTPMKTLKGYLEFMCCDGKQCLAPKIVEFTLNLK